MNIFNVVTNCWLYDIDYYNFSKKARISPSTACKFFKTSLACRNQFIKEKDLNKIFVIKNINTNQEFKCINAMSMEEHLNIHFSRNELARLHNLKAEKIFCIKLRDQHYIKVNSDKEKIKSYQRLTAASPEYQKQYNHDYREKHREQELKRNRIWKENNKSKIKSYNKIYFNERYNNDLNYKIKQNLRNRIRDALKSQSAKKSAHTLELIGCSIEEFKTHFASKFTPDMSWEDVMNGKIHIDHIRPFDSFDDLKDPAQQRICCHYTNLQPLWAADNLKKGCSIPI